ncbi:MAG: hypothetical protein QOI74_1393 [Micromonosporaceae bacterium]|nr:hypothetical protein [Micromonosporaceae bacterium]
MLIEIFQLAAMALHNTADAPDSPMSHVRDQQTSVVVTVDSPAQSIRDQFAHAFTAGAIALNTPLEINIIGGGGN